MRFRCQSASAAVLATAAVVTVAACNANPQLLAGAINLLLTAAAQSPGPTPPFQTGCALVDPPDLSPADAGMAGPHTLDVHLTARAATVNISGDRVTTHVLAGGGTVPTDTRCYANGDLFLAPTLRVDPGDRLRVTLTNDQQDTGWTTNLHFHGLHVSPASDDDTGAPSDDTFVGVPPAGLATGSGTEQYDVQVPTDNPVGTDWYHGAFHPAEPQLAAGEAGLIEVGDLNALLPAPLRHVVTHRLMLSDLQFQAGTNRVIPDNVDSGARRHGWSTTSSSR